MPSQYNHYMQQHFHLYKTFYDHQKLAPKITIKKDKIFALPKKINNQIQSQNTNLNLQKTNNNIQNINKNPQKSIKQNNLKYGRQLFTKQINNNQTLGPGQYNPPLLRSNSFGYIPKPSQINLNPLIQFYKLKSNSLGPGKYKHQQSQSHLSGHKSSKGATFSSRKLIRCIISSNNRQNINLHLNQQTIDKKQGWKTKLGPGSYQQQNNSNNIKNNNSKFTKSKTYSISMTQRSSLVTKSTIPGPGYYQWSKYLQKNKIKNNPIIQFKFVHANQ